MKKLTARLIPLLLAALLLLTACGKANTPAGTKKFTLEITFTDGSTTTQEIETDKPTVGEALEALNLIEGEQGAYGLYVTTVGGETLIYDESHSYWAFYINGDYASAGVDSTEVEDGASYSFKVQKVD